MHLVNYEEVLENCSFSEILEINELTEADVLEYLVEQNYLILPVTI